MRFLLDENFPLALYRRLRDAGKEVEHVIALGQRGVGDDVLRKRLATETLVFLTHDEEFGDIPADFRSQVIISDLPQRRPPERLFEILPSGELVAWEILEVSRRLRGPI